VKKWRCVLLKKLIGITDKLQILTFLRVRLKANRSRIDSFSGIGDEKLKILEKCRKLWGSYRN
jgi:2-dehydro-3-deoxyphosphooctonate aldolase (KDO 8-P synthase)